VRVPGCKGEFSVEPGKMTFHDGEGMNYVMYIQRRIEFDGVLCTVETPRYSVRATQTGFEGDAVFTVTDNYDRAPTPASALQQSSSPPFAPPSNSPSPPSVPSTPIAHPRNFDW
jgi:hypothetical protein